MGPRDGWWQWVGLPHPKDIQFRFANESIIKKWHKDMKKKLLYSVCSLVMACALASCDYLDIVPDGTPTEKDAFANQGTTEGYLYSCYGFMPSISCLEMRW